jgi:hypothetical protein
MTRADSHGDSQFPSQSQPLLSSTPSDDSSVKSVTHKAGAPPTPRPPPAPGKPARARVHNTRANALKQESGKRDTRGGNRTPRKIADTQDIDDAGGVVGLLHHITGEMDAKVDYVKNKMDKMSSAFDKMVQATTKMFKLVRESINKNSIRTTQILKRMEATFIASNTRLDQTLDLVQASQQRSTKMMELIQSHLIGICAPSIVVNGSSVAPIKAPTDQENIDPLPGCPISPATMPHDNDAMVPLDHTRNHTDMRTTTQTPDVSRPTNVINPYSGPHIPPPSDVLGNSRAGF